MDIRTNSYFTGDLKIWDINCHFSFSEGYLLEIKPEKNEVEVFKEMCKQKSNYNSLGCLLGTSSYGYDIVFILADEQGPFPYYKGNIKLIVDIVVSTLNSKDSKGEYISHCRDLHGFNAIDFMGEAVDLIFNPKQIIKKEARTKDGILWGDYSELIKVFPTTIYGKACNIIFTVWIDRQDLTLENTGLGSLHSIIRLEFNDRQDITFIETCWQSICTFLSFCVGQFNITDLQIGLWDEAGKIGGYGAPGIIDCHINNDRVENVLFRYPAYNVFQIDTLNDKVGNLFELLNDKTKRPILSFMKRTNYDNNVDKNKIRDICTALEVEFDFRKSEYSNTATELLVKQLKDTVKLYKKENPNVIEDNTYNYIFGSLNFISLPAREKVIFIYAKYREIIDIEFKKMVIFSQYKLDLTEEQTNADIAWIVKARNNITHSSGITEQEIPNAIYNRLKIAIYCSVLERAGYSIEEIDTIIKKYFDGM